MVARENEVMRIVSLYPAATEIACAIGLREQLVGVSHECRRPAGIESLPRLTRGRVDSSADSRDIDAQVKSLLSTRQPLYELDEQLIDELQPDLILAQAQCEVCAVSADWVAAVVAERPTLDGTRVLALNPRSLAEVLHDIERVGAAAGATGQARRLRASLAQRVAEVQAAVTSGRRRPRVAVIEWIEPLMIAGNWTPELIALAGGECTLTRVGEPSPYVFWTELVQFAPELVVVAPCGFGLARSRREAAQLESHAAWASLPAVQRGRVHVVDGDQHFNCPGPRLVESLELLAGWIQDVMI
jgi:iron complex transport system substrate-binding protein